MDIGRDIFGCFKNSFIGLIGSIGTNKKNVEIITKINFTDVLGKMWKRVGKDKCPATVAFDDWFEARVRYKSQGGITLYEAANTHKKG